MSTIAARTPRYGFWLLCAFFIFSEDAASAQNASSTNIIVKYRNTSLMASTRSSGASDVARSLGKLDGHAQFAQTVQSLGLASQGLKLKSSLSENSVLVKPSASVGASGAAMTDLLHKLASDPNVEYAEFDSMRYASKYNDPLLGQQWNVEGPRPNSLAGSNVREVWKAANKNGRGVTIAVLDTGYLPHADLIGSLLPGYDFITAHAISNDGDGRDSEAFDHGDGRLDSSPSSWHGTAVAGVLASPADNGVGIAGVAHNAKIVPVRVLGVNGGLVSDIVSAIRWAAGLPVPGVPDNPNPAKVINLSLSATAACSRAEQDAINAVRAKGVVVIAAAGNEGASHIGAPANCAGVLAVVAHTAAGDLAAYSNTGAGASISAPGGGQGLKASSLALGIPAPSNTGKISPVSDTYMAFTGTSFSAPQVSGVVALVMAEHPQLTPSEIERAVVGSARNFTPESSCYGNAHCGTGMLDALAAMAAARATVPGKRPS